MIAILMVLFMYVFIFRRAKAEDQWRQEQRIFWTRLRKDLTVIKNELKKINERH